MSDEDDGPPEKKGGGGAPGWIVTFSDLMSLLLAFFVLLFSFSSIEDEKFDQVGGSLKEAFGVQRKILAHEKLKGINYIAEEYSSARPDMTIVNIVPPELIEDIRRFLSTQAPQTPDEETEANYGSGNGHVKLEQDKSQQDQQDPEPLKMKDPSEDPPVDLEKLIAKLLQQLLEQQEKMAELQLATMEASQQAADARQEAQAANDAKEVAEQALEAAAMASSNAGENGNQGTQSGAQEDTASKSFSTEIDSAIPEPGALDSESISPTFPDLDSDPGKPEGMQNESGEGQELIQQIKNDFQEEIAQGIVEVVVENGKIIIRINEQGLFASGSADLLQSIDPILSKVKETLYGVKGTVSVAGHTDNKPISTSRYRSNWELSAARAVTVVHELTKDGILPAERFQVEGYGDTEPIASNSTSEGRARNRRVEVIIMEEQIRQKSPTKKRAAPKQRNGQKPRSKNKQLDEIPNIVPPLSITKFDPIFSGR